MARFDARDALPAPLVARRSFDRAAASFDHARHVHDEARRRLIERLAFVRLNPSLAVDLGCATGAGAVELATLFPSATVLGIDSSLPMLRVARRGPRAANHSLVCATAEGLPLGERSTDLVLANMLLPWCRPDAVFAEVARVLREGGLFLFATVGPDSLEQVRRAWARVDDRVHVHASFDMHDLGDQLVAAGLEEPVMDTDRLSVTYRNVRTLIEDLRACGAANVAAGRRRGLTGRERWRGFESALRVEGGGERLGVTVELVFGQAWGRRSGRALPGEDEVRIPAETLLRRSRQNP